MKITCARTIQALSVFIFYSITLFFVQRALAGLQVNSMRSLAEIIIAFLLFNSVYDPVTQKMAGFKNQEDHHRDMGNPHTIDSLYARSCHPMLARP